MILRTGKNKEPVFLEVPVCKKAKQRFLAGFTLLEVMITAVVLALGATLIYESFFIAIDSFNYSSTLLEIIPWMDEKIWQAQDEIKRLGPGAVIPTGGQLNAGDKNISWGLTYRPIDGGEVLYQIDLALFLPQGKRQVKLSRSAYAIYPGKK